MVILAEYINIVIESLNNREVAILIWIFLSFIICLSIKDIRKSLFKVIQSFLTPKILFPILLLLAILIFVAIILNLVNLWEPSLITEMVIWFFGTALGSFFGTLDATREQDYFKKYLKSTISVLLVFEFIVNAYAFSLIIELISVPLLFFLSAASVISEKKYKDYRQVKIFVDTILAIYVFIALYFTIRQIIQNWNSFASLQNLEVFLLPLLLSFITFPYYFALTVAIIYESFFLRLKRILKSNDQDFFQELRRRILFRFNLNLEKLRRLSRVNLAFLSTLQSENEVMDYFINETEKSSLSTHTSIH